MGFAKQNKTLKFLCSYGGNIMPRPGDSTLRYVGGDTRLVVVNRDISFHELMKRMEDLCSFNAKMKYQLPNADLDLLVSVTCDEDLSNMFEEYDKLERLSNKSTRLRVFLFPVKAPVVSCEEGNPTQRYIDLVNGCVAASQSSCKQLPQQRCSLRINRNLSFSDGSDSSPASNKVPFLSPPGSPSLAYVNHGGDCNSRSSQMMMMKKVPSESMMTTPCSPPNVSVVGYSNNIPPLYNNPHHMHRVRSTPNLVQYPQSCCFHTSRYTSNNRQHPVSHRLAGPGLLQHSMIPASCHAASTRASPLQNMYSVDMIDH